MSVLDQLVGAVNTVVLIAAVLSGVFADKLTVRLGAWGIAAIAALNIWSVLA